MSTRQASDDVSLTETFQLIYRRATFARKVLDRGGEGGVAAEGAEMFLFGSACCF